MKFLGMEDLKQIAEANRIFLSPHEDKLAGVSDRPIVVNVNSVFISSSWSWSWENWDPLKEPKNRFALIISADQKAMLESMREGLYIEQSLLYKSHKTKLTIAHESDEHLVRAILNQGEAQIEFHHTHLKILKFFLKHGVAAVV